MTIASRHGWPPTPPLALDRSVEPGPAAPPTSELDPERDPVHEGHPLADTLHPPRRSTTTVLDRTRILRATAECLEASGYDGTTIRRIAQRLDCAVGSIYRHYRDKRELLAAVCEARFEPVFDALERDGLDASVRAYLAVAAANPESYRLMFWLAALERQGKAVALPDAVVRLIASWAAHLGGADAARAGWREVHGRAMLGETEGVTLAPAAPSGITAPAPPAQPARELAPSDPAPSPAAADEAYDDAPEADDLTML